MLMLSAVLLTASATAAAGPVSFVALTAPQLARRLTRSPGTEPGRLDVHGGRPAGPRRLRLAAGVRRGATALWGVVTGVVGGVYLLWLLVTERRAGRI
ncbi:hypothetical protein GCM10019016_110750 [Streptomyces prasinosporus]|uniref:Uncharacterized protein n=1 Tax=Streptomyces prasinosporus TaxID=68256 RepID=A0ABP6U8B0_9ACTN